MRDVSIIAGAYRFRSLASLERVSDLSTRNARGLISRDIANLVLPISTGYRFNGAGSARVVWRTVAHRYTVETLRASISPRGVDPAN